MTTVAVDFDGVIHAYSRGWHDGSIYDEPIPGAFDAVCQLQDDGYAVMIHSTREPQQIADWLLRYDTGFSLCVDGPSQPDFTFWDDRHAVLITKRKLPAVAYIDDRAIRFTSWPQALADLTAAVETR